MSGRLAIAANLDGRQRVDWHWSPLALRLLGEWWRVVLKKQQLAAPFLANLPASAHPSCNPPGDARREQQAKIPAEVFGPAMGAHHPAAANPRSIAPVT